MKAKTSFLRMTIGLAFITALASSCDDLNVDPDKGKPAVDISDNTIFIRSGSSAFIDLTSKVTTNQAVTLTINSDATLGELSSLGNGLLQYSTKSGLASGRDGFGYTITNQSNEVLKQDSVIIIVEEDSTSLPLGIYPADDIVFGVTAGTEIIVDALANDYFSTYSINELELTIYSPDAAFPPYVGTASIVNNKVVYTPGSGFSGADKVVYKIAVKNNPSVAAFGLVYLSGEQGCSFTLSDDSFTSTEPFNEIRISALSNDELCQAINNYSVTISQQPALGNVYVESNQFVYQLTQTAENGFSDFFIYKVNIDGVNKTARVNISVNSDSVSTCTLTAIPDFIDLIDSVASVVYIDVLKNDVTCDLNVTLTIDVDPTNGTALVVSDGGKPVIKYIPNTQQVADDKISYKITRGDTVSMASVLIKRTN